VRVLRELGFAGPFSGSRHQYMVFAGRRLAIPSNAEYEVEGIIGRAITADEWQ
jgi:hypothetical protein